eukprot:jgi/Undpi1/4465/HiC_scaffold_17.g07819.m1
MWVCPYNNYGCDSKDLEEKCVGSSNSTDAGAAIATFFPGGDYHQEVEGVGKETPSQKGWCVEFKTSEVKPFLGEERNATKDLDYFKVNASWYPGGGPGASTTCVAEGESWEAHRLVYTESSSPSRRSVGIGRNEQHNIAGETAVSYKALSVTSSVYRDKVIEDVTDPYAYLEVQMQQEPDSWEIVTEIDPLNVGEILGSIGGFWGRFHG